ncbi:MAG: hypothetical protein GDA45_02915 [Chromatiales bacterium]|nr:hypothetical protein [Chromatiales bacterium]
MSEIALYSGLTKLGFTPYLWENGRLIGFNLQMTYAEYCGVAANDGRMMTGRY